MTKLLHTGRYIIWVFGTEVSKHPHLVHKLLAQKWFFNQVSTHNRNLLRSAQDALGHELARLDTHYILPDKNPTQWLGVRKSTTKDNITTFTYRGDGDINNHTLTDFIKNVLKPSYASTGTINFIIIPVVFNTTKKL